MSASSPSQTVFSINCDFHLGSGNNGNVWGIVNNRDASRNQTFTYDPLNRLLSAQNAGTDCTKTLPDGHTEYWGNSYVYDPWGNLNQKQVTKCSAENLSLTIASNNRAQGGSYLYDAAGNMLRDNNGTNYVYDPENRISSTAGYTYVYDGDGNRVKKSNSTTGTLYWYASPGIIAESDLSGNVQHEYIFFAGERVARKNVGNQVFYYFSDHLKTASMVTDATGNIKNESDYYPWGGELQLTNNFDNRYKFTGKERDPESGLDYFGARYYGNALGRFLTPDWAAKPVTVPYAHFGDPQSLNLYGYVRNLPTTGFDADGHQNASLSFGKDWISSWVNPGRWAGAVTADVYVRGWRACLKDAGQGALGSLVNLLPVSDHGIKNSPTQNNVPNTPSGHAGAFATALALPALSSRTAVAGVVDMTATVKAPSVIQQLQGAANTAAETVGTGSGPLYGTAVHSEFAAQVDALGNANLAAEQSYLGGQPVNYGTPGSVRVDVVEGPVDAPTAVYRSQNGQCYIDSCTDSTDPITTSRWQQRASKGD